MRNAIRVFCAQCGAVWIRFTLTTGERAGQSHWDKQCLCVGPNGISVTVKLAPPAPPPQEDD